MQISSLSQSMLSGIGNVTESARAVEAPESRSASASPSFGSMLASLVSEAGHSLQASEQIAAEGLAGNVSVQRVAESIMQAERQLHAAIAIRDKVIAAYQEITHMAI